MTQTDGLNFDRILNEYLYTKVRYVNLKCKLKVKGMNWKLLLKKLLTENTYKCSWFV